MSSGDGKWRSESTGTVAGATTVPAGSQTYLVGLVMEAAEAGGSANSVRQLQSVIEINSNVLQIAAIN